MKRVISIQSQVVHGHVGNSAAVYPLQALGFAVAAVPTALLSNHPHYPTIHGRTLEPELVAGLLRGVEERGWVEDSAALITGYLGAPETAQVVADFVERAKARNPNLIAVCDPVMGDDDLGIFVNPDLIAIFRERLVPLAAVTTPNQYELELLSGVSARTPEALAKAAAMLAARGTGAVVATGCVLNDTPPGAVESVAIAPQGLARSATPRLPIRPCGTGDLFTALLTAALCEGADLAAATARATAAIFAVLQRTQAEGAEEMRLLGFPFGAPEFAS